MPNETALLVICITLVVIIILIFTFGIVSYKIYLKQNANQLSKMVNDYKAIAATSIENTKITHDQLVLNTELMKDFTDYLSKIKKKNL